MSNETVVVGCKLPQGLILRLYEQRPGDSPKVTAEVTLAGRNAARVLGGYGITRVSRDFWDAWIKSHAQIPAVANGFIFAVADDKSARDCAKERQKLRTDLEPLDPLGDPRNNGKSMLGNEDGELDKKLVSQYRALCAQNPDRHNTVDEL